MIEGNDRSTFESHSSTPIEMGEGPFQDAWRSGMTEEAVGKDGNPLFTGEYEYGNKTLHVRIAYNENMRSFVCDPFVKNKTREVKNKKPNETTVLFGVCKEAAQNFANKQQQSVLVRIHSSFPQIRDWAMSEKGLSIFPGLMIKEDPPTFREPYKGSYIVEPEK